jgi:hypothetical protein
MTITKKPRKLRAGEVTFTLRCEPEFDAVEGNCVASGDDAYDRECAERIRQQLDDGNGWAWCIAVVEAGWEGFGGSAVLGCCCYESEAAFRDCPYFAELKAEALADLNANVADAAARLSRLEKT